MEEEEAEEEEAAAAVEEEAEEEAAAAGCAYGGCALPATQACSTHGWDYLLRARSPEMRPAVAGPSSG